MIRRLALLAAVVLAAALSSPGQLDPGEKPEYVDEKLQAALNGLPQLAWVLPGGTVATEGRAPVVHLYSRSNAVEVARLQSTMTAAKVLVFRNEHHVACDVPFDEEKPVLSLYASTVKQAAGNPQVLATASEWAGVQMGFEHGALAGAAAKEAWKRMEPKSPQQPRRGGVIRRAGVTHFYSLAALYDGPKKEVSRRGLFLHAGDGRILGARVEDIRGEWCDGCTVPTFDEGLERVFVVENMLTAPQFAYPLIMLDTSTMEGRSITLATFSPEGRYSRRLFYEYVVGCLGKN
jgi:hypothetical protein